MLLLKKNIKKKLFLLIKIYSFEIINQAKQIIN